MLALIHISEEQLSQQKESLKVKAAATSTDLSELQTKIQELKAAEEKKKEEAAKAEKAPSSDSSGQSGNSGTGNNSNNSSSSGGSSSNKKYNYPSGPGQLNPWVGVVYFNGHRETYYSQRDVYKRQAVEFLKKLVDMVEFLIPNYIAEGKTQLVIAIGCTGGKHRSVTLANALYEAINCQEQYGVRIEHRDIEKDAVTKAR